MDLDLEGRRVIVTGGASNIGRAIVLAFAGHGSQVAVLDRDGDQAARTADEAAAAGAGRTAVSVTDLADVDAAIQATRGLVALLGGVDVLVNNVGWARPDLFLDTPVDRWAPTLAANLVAPMAVTRAVLEPMVTAGRGAIVSISSDAAAGEARQSVYGAAKAGVIAFARAIAREYGPSGVRSNVVAPGLVLPGGDADTGELSLWRERSAVFTDEQVEWVRRRVPLRRLSRAADVANAVLFLASDVTGRQLTGQVLSVSGGYWMPG